MSSALSLTLYLVVVVPILQLALLVPMRWAARVMNARRTGFWWCLLALAGATLLQGLAAAVWPGAGNLVAFLVSAVAFAAVLGTGFLDGVGLAVLHLFFTGIVLVVVVLLMLLTGLLASVTGWL